MGALTQAIERWRSGDDSAQFDLHTDNRLALAKLLKLIRCRRIPSMAKRIDSEAVLNEGMLRLLAGIRGGNFPNVRTSSDLNKVLFAIVMNVLHEGHRYHGRQRRTPLRESSTAHLQPDSSLPAECIQVDLLELLNLWLREHSDSDNLIFEYYLAGYASRDIAELCQLSLRTVQVKLSQMRESLERKLCE